MRYALILLAFIGGASVFSISTATEANAVVCAKGVVRAGCASARGAAVVRKPVVVRRRVY